MKTCFFIGKDLAQEFQLVTAVKDGSAVLTVCPRLPVKTYYNLTLPDWFVELPEPIRALRFEALVAGPCHDKEE